MGWESIRFMLLTCRILNRPVPPDSIRVMVQLCQILLVGKI